MKYFTQILAICILLFATTQCEKEFIYHPFVIIVPSYNNHDWYKQNLDSIFFQNYPNYRVIYINDASKDDTGELVKNYLDHNNLWDKCTYIENSTNHGALYNLYHAIHSCENHEIVILVDGDDWLKDLEVLARVNQEYQDPNVWLTYGQFEWSTNGSKGFCCDYPREVIKHNSFREAVWVSTHLRTFYVQLFKKVKMKDLMYQNTFFKVAWDLAMVYPMLEMAQERHRCIPDVLYVYNNHNPLNDSKLYAHQQLVVDHIVRKKQRYFRLKNLWE